MLHEINADLAMQKSHQSLECLLESCAFDTCSIRSLQVNEDRVFSTFIDIDKTHLRLTYTSGHQKTLSRKVVFEILGPVVPANLRRINLQIRVQGREFKAILEPEANLKYEWIWNGLDCYDQPVFGKSLATIQVEYQLTNCLQSKTDRKSFQIHAFVPFKRHFHGWSLDRQHVLDTKSLLLHLGNGQIKDLTKDRDAVPFMENVLETEDDEIPVSIVTNGKDILFIATNTALYRINIQTEEVNNNHHMLYYKRALHYRSP